MNIRSSEDQLEWALQNLMIAILSLLSSIISFHTIIQAALQVSATNLEEK